MTSVNIRRELLEQLSTVDTDEMLAERQWQIIRQADWDLADNAMG